METGIYEILNTANNKWYRGQVQADYGFEERWYHHKIKLKAGTHGNPHLQSSWDKYGEGAFKFTILSRCAPEFCDELEIYWIGDDYNNPAVSYNKKAGGGNNLLSEETKAKISEAHTGKKLTEEHKQKLSEALKGRKPTESTKKKMSEAQKGENHPLYGKKHTEETKQKMSESRKGENNPSSKPFTVVFPDGHVDQWGYAREAAEAYGVGKNTISHYLNGKNTPGGRKRTAHLKDTIWQHV